MLGMPRTKSDPELLPVHRPRCPSCQTRMIMAEVSPGPEGFERCTYQCSKCSCTEIRVEVCNSFNPGAVGWATGAARERPVD